MIEPSENERENETPNEGREASCLSYKQEGGIPAFHPNPNPNPISQRILDLTVMQVENADFIGRYLRTLCTIPGFSFLQSSLSVEIQSRVSDPFVEASSR